MSSSPSPTLRPLCDCKDPQLSAQLLLVDVVSSRERDPGDLVRPHFSVRRGLAPEVQVSLYSPCLRTAQLVYSPPVSGYNLSIPTVVGRCAMGAAHIPLAISGSPVPLSAYGPPVHFACNARVRKPRPLALTSPAHNRTSYSLYAAPAIFSLCSPWALCHSYPTHALVTCRRRLLTAGLLAPDFFFFCSPLALRVIPTPHTSSSLAIAILASKACDPSGWRVAEEVFPDANTPTPYVTRVFHSGSEGLNLATSSSGPWLGRERSASAATGGVISDFTSTLCQFYAGFTSEMFPVGDRLRATNNIRLLSTILSVDPDLSTFSFRVPAIA
ncbi:hypothetical protein DFH06DRAFT_1326823 [Mycena polygramma]|nr:hypothetical protein DFH06DRAFT_1326823 [Mycena polygramma]